VLVLEDLKLLMTQLMIRYLNISVYVVTKLWAVKGGSHGKETIINYFLVKRMK
jgi:hypothetical protein